MTAINRLTTTKDIVITLKLNGIGAELTKTKAQIMKMERRLAKEWKYINQ